MHGYLDQIAEAAQVTLPEAALLEELMRIEHPTLDALTPRSFDACACRARATRDLLREVDPDALGWYEQRAQYASNL